LFLQKIPYVCPVKLKGKMKATVNPNMIMLAREARGLSQLQLAQSIGMSATNLSKIERCDIG
jgi:ribosome-binding protein aMBF1 (putative translation factor)